VVEYLLGIIIKKLLKSDVSMWDPFKTLKMRVSIVDALRSQVESINKEIERKSDKYD
jgi:hypothetical protein